MQEKKTDRLCGCLYVRLILVLVWKKLSVLVYGTYYVPARTAVQASCLVRVKKSKNEMFK